MNETMQDIEKTEVVQSTILRGPYLLFILKFGSWAPVIEIWALEIEYLPPKLACLQIKFWVR